MSDLICDPYAPDICLPTNMYDTIIKYSAGGKKQRKHIAWLDAKLMMVGVPVMPANTGEEPDVLLNGKMKKNKINKKVFKALRNSEWDGEVFINNGGSRDTLCQAISDDGASIVVIGDGSWYVPTV